MHARIQSDSFGVEYPLVTDALRGDLPAFGGARNRTPWYSVDFGGLRDREQGDQLGRGGCHVSHLRHLWHILQGRHARSFSPCAAIARPNVFHPVCWQPSTALQKLTGGNSCQPWPSVLIVRFMTTALEAGHIPPNRLCYRLLLARLEAGLTAQELAERMGVSRDVVSRAENGRRKPRKIVFNAWALATGVPVTWLIDGVGQMTPEDPDDPARPRGFEPLTFCLEVADNVTRLFPEPAEATKGSPADLRAAG